MRIVVLSERSESKDLVALLSVIYALFHFPYTVTPLFPTLTKTAGVCMDSSHSGTWRLRVIRRGCGGPSLRRTDVPRSDAPLSSFDATLTKNRGEGVCPSPAKRFGGMRGFLCRTALRALLVPCREKTQAVSKSPKPAKLFPMFLKLAGRPCLVVGAGAIGESKIASLVEAGARVRVVAPEATEQVRSWAQSGKVDWQARPFQPDDLDNMFLVVASTSSTELHEQIFAEATRRGVLCNVVDVPALCDFYYPAVVQRGALQIAVSTAGLSPALAQRLRQQLEKQFGEEYAAWVEQLGEAREKLLRARMDPEERKRRLHALAGEAAFEAFLHKRPGAKSKSSGAKAPRKRRR